MRYKCAKNLTLYAVVQSLVTVQYNYLKIIINFNVKNANMRIELNFKPFLRSD